MNFALTTFDGKRKKGRIARVHNEGGVLVVSYEALRMYQHLLRRYKWFYVVLDEGHKIKNPRCQVTEAVKAVEASNRLILSGTPIQNSLEELWSLFDFIEPGALGSLGAFRGNYCAHIRKAGLAGASFYEVRLHFHD